MSTKARPTSLDVQQNSHEAMNASRVALSQAKAGVTRHLLTHRTELTQLKGMQGDVPDSIDQLKAYEEPYLVGSGEHFSEEAQLDENDPLEGHDFDAVSGVKQVQGSKVRLESYQEVAVKTPLKLSSATQTVNYGTYHHDFIDISQNTYQHLWTRGIETISWLTDTRSSYITDWDVASIANRRCAVGNDRLYADYLSLQIGQGDIADVDTLNPDNTELDGDYGDLSVEVQSTIHVIDRFGGILVEATESNIGVQSTKDSKYYSRSQMTVEAEGDTYVNGQTVFINTVKQGPPPQPTTYTQSYDHIRDLPKYEVSPTNRKLPQPRWTDQTKETLLQKPSNQKSGAKRFQRRKRYL